MSTLKDFNLMVRNQNTQAYLVDVLGEKKDGFVANLTTLVANDRNLQQCEPTTLMYAAMTATALDLPLDKNLGQAYVIPFKNGKAGSTEAQFQIGWKGLVTLAQRSGTIRLLNATDVREGELKKRNLLTGQIVIEPVEEREKKPIIGYAAYVMLSNGFEKTVYMSREEVEAHAKRYSQTYRSTNQYTRNASKWTTDFDAMALKTVLKQLINKWVPKDTKMNIALQADQSIQREYGDYHYADNDKEQAQGKLADLAAGNVEDVAEEEEETETTEESHETTES
jgi:recombination protein RecT